MGFQAPRRVYTLDFADTELDGLTVKTTSAPIDMLLRMGSLVDAVGGAPDPEALAALPQDEQVKAVAGFMGTIESLVKSYAGVLISWDLEDAAGQPVPATEAGLRTLDPAHLMLIIRAWQQAVAEVPAPLDGASTGGSPLEALSTLPMEPLSQSLAS